tara:strand:+ start:20365 stop:26304 length:5940 start_codon:yes stop_codon:yes gene_type:complete
MSLTPAQRQALSQKYQQKFPKAPAVPKAPTPIVEEEEVVETVTAPAAVSQPKIEAPAAPKPIEKPKPTFDVEAFRTSEKKRDEYRRKMLPEMQQRRDEIVDALYKTRGQEFGFTAGTEEDREAFVDYAIKDFVENKNVNPIIASPVARDFLNYEAIKRYGATITPRGERYEAQQALLKGYEEDKKRAEKRSQLQTDLTESLKARGNPDARVVTVFEDGSVQEAYPYWEKYRGDEIETQINKLNDRTPIGNAAGVKFDLEEEAKVQDAILRINPLDLPKEEREKFVRQQQYILTSRELARLPREGTVKKGLIIVPQVQQSDGTYAVDLDQKAYNLSLAYLIDEARDKGVSSIPELQKIIGPEKLRDLRKELLEKAQKRMQSTQLQGLGGVLYIADREKFKQDLIEGRDPLSYFDPVLSFAGLYDRIFPQEDQSLRSKVAQFEAPFKRVLYPQSFEGMGQGTLYYGRTLDQLGEGYLDYFLDFGPWRPIMSWLLDPRQDVEWGSIEHLTRQEQGYSVFRDIPQITQGLEALGVSPTAAKGAAWYAALGLVLTEPDLFTLVTGGLGKVATTPAKLAAEAAGVGRIGDVAKARKAEKEAAQIREIVAQMGENPEDLDAALDALDTLRREEAAGFISRAIVAGELALPPAGQNAEISAQISDLSRKSLKELEATEGIIGEFARQERRVLSELNRVLDEQGVSKQLADEVFGEASTNLRAYYLHKLQQSENQDNFIRAAQASGERLSDIAKTDLRGVLVPDLSKLTVDVMKSKAALQTATTLTDDVAKLNRQIARAETTVRTTEDAKALAKLEKDRRELMSKLAKAQREIKPGLIKAPIDVAARSVATAAREAAEAKALLKKTYKAATGKNLSETIFMNVDEYAALSQARSKAQGLVGAPLVAKIQESLTQVADSLDAYRDLLRKPKIEQQALLERRVDTEPTKFVTRTSPNKFTLDAGAWLDSLEAEFSGRELAAAIARVGGTVEGEALTQKLLSRAVVPVSARDLERLKLITDPLAGKTLTETESAISIGRGVVEAWQSNTRTLGRVKTLEDMAAYVVNQIMKIGDKVDARRSRLGRFETNVQDVVKRALVRGEDAENEFVTYLLGNIDTEGTNFSTLAFKALDTSENLPLVSKGVFGTEQVTPSRVAVFNHYNELTVFQNFKKYVQESVQGMSDEELTSFLASRDGAFYGTAVSFLPASITTMEKEIGALMPRAFESLMRASTAEEYANLLRKNTFFSFRGAYRTRAPKPSALDEVTDEVIDAVDPLQAEHVSLSFLSRSMLLGQNRRLINQNLADALGPSMTPAAAQKANFILSGARADSSSSAFESVITGRNVGFDPTEAIEAIRSWGVTFDSDIMNDVADAAQGAADLQMGFLRVGRNAAGESIFAAAPLIKQIEVQLDTAIKTLNRTGSHSKLTDKHVNQTSTWLRLWRTSVTRGLFVPRPAYFANQMAGDFAQMLMMEGALTARRGPDGALYFSGAVPMAFQNAFTYVPYFGPKITQALEDVGAAARAQGKLSLTSPLNAFVNPHVQSVLTNRKPDELYKVKEGTATSSQLLAEMSERNVFDALYSEDMRKAAADIVKRFKPPEIPFGTELKKAKKAATWWQDYSEVLVRQTQDHQRAAMYLEYRLRRGATAKEAQKAVEDTFYDWRHGVSQNEMNKLAYMSAFYPYFRLSMQQMASALTQPLTYSGSDLVKYSILGTGKLNRVRKSGNIVFGLPDYVNDNSGEELGYAEAVQVAGMKTRPEFYGSRPILASELTPEGKQQIRIGPSFGTFETVEIYLTLLQAMVGSAAIANFPGTEDFIVGEDFNEQVFDTLITDQLNPIMRTGVKGAWDGFSGKSMSPAVRIPDRLEALKLMERYPFIGEALVPNRYGELTMPRAFRDGLDAVPFFGTELPRLTKTALSLNKTINPTDEAEWDVGTKRGMAWLLSEWLGFTRRYEGLSAEEGRDITARKIRRSAEDVLREAGGRAEGTREFLETD